MDFDFSDISQGMLVKINKQCYEKLEVPDNVIKNYLMNSTIAHHDESGARVNGKLYWCHVMSTKYVTHYSIHVKRGKKGFESTGILPGFKGRLIHDFFKPYLTYSFQHGLCNAHHLRELKFIAEEQKQDWAKHMSSLLLAINNQVGWHTENRLKLSEVRIQSYERCYDEILMMGLWHPPNLPQSINAPKRGKRKQSKAKNLLDRLRFYRENVLAFMYDPSVLFTNNQAEQDIRMVKIKQKVSGCFRSIEGAHWFVRIRSYLSTAKKQGENILSSLINVFNNNPYIPLNITH